MKREKMTTIDMKKIPKRRRDSRKFSSSDGVEVLNPPINILALGSHLTDELGFIESRDTLGGWMAHYVAELIAKAANAQEGAAKHEAELIAAKEILNIWSHRSSLPGNAYPLSRYKDIIESLSLLASGGSLWERPAEGSYTAKAGEVYEQLRQLSLACLFSDLYIENSEVNAAAKAHLDSEESRLFNMLTEWSQSVCAQRNSHAATPSEIDELSQSPELVDPNELLTLIIDSSISKLQKLKSLLK